MKGKEMKIAILTSFEEFNPGYSLTGIVQDQATMLTRYGHDVSVYVSEKFNPESFPTNISCPVLPRVPATDLIDYDDGEKLTDEHHEVAKKFCNLIAKDLADFDFVFTHDLVYIGWYLPYSQGIYFASRMKELKSLRWLHWVHSVPSVMRNWRNIKMYGPAHKIVYPNKTNSLHTIAHFCGDPEDVKVIPHIKDIRSWWEFDPETWEFLDEFPTVLNSDIIQVYPASTDRLLPKRVDVVIKLFARIKKRGNSVCLIIANQWATGRQRKQDVEKLILMASRNGLKRNEDIIFTSEWKEKYRNGLPRRILRELMLLGNAFIFPTREESFGLVAPEEALSGPKMPFLNKSLDMMMEVNGLTGVYCNFGSFEQSFDYPDLKLYYDDLATLLLAKLTHDDAIMFSTFHRKTYNMDTIYRKYYEPIMSEGKQLWTTT
jgi:glycosyltransferase involved in cell wall biosynthesis